MRIITILGPAITARANNLVKSLGVTQTALREAAQTILEPFRALAQVILTVLCVGLMLVGWRLRK